MPADSSVGHFLAAPVEPSRLDPLPDPLYATGLACIRAGWGATVIARKAPRGPSATGKASHKEQAAHRVTLTVGQAIKR